MIGYNDVGNAYEPFNGEIDDVRIYNRILSESEIQELYNEGSSGDDCKATWENNILTVPCVEFTDRDGNVRIGSYESLVRPRKFIRGYTEAE